MIEASIVIVNWNTSELLRACLDSVDRHRGPTAVEVIVVDNASTDGSLDVLREEYPHVRVIANRENRGFAGANNQGAREASGRYLLLLNSDAALTPGALASLLRVAEDRSRVGLVGARLVNPDGSFQASFCRLPTLWQELLILSGLGRILCGPHYPSRGPEETAGPQPAGYVVGACMLVRRDAYLAVGGFDESFFMYAEDVDLCAAVQRRGWEVWYQPNARVVHVGGGSSRNRRPEREARLYRGRVRYFRKHRGAAAAAILKAAILAFTTVKIPAHGLLRMLSRGRLGRPVVGIRQLLATFREA